MRLLLTATAMSALVLGGLNPVQAKEHHPKQAHHAKKHHHRDQQMTVHERLDDLTRKVEELRDTRLTEETGVTDGNLLDLKITGQVNKAALYVDNGKNTNTQYVDNDNEFTVVDLTATGKWNEDTTVGGTLAIKAGQNSSNATDVKNSSNNTDSLTVYKGEVFVSNKRFGQINLGRGSMASDTTMEATDLSGTTVVAIGASVYEMAGGTQFINKNTNSKFAVTNGVNGNGSTNGNVRVNSVFADVDGADVQDRVTYETPEFMGFKLSGGHAYNTTQENRGNDLWDVALKYAAKFSGHQFAAQVAFVEDNSRPQIGTDGEATGFEQVNASAGILLCNGLNLFVSGSHRDWDFHRARDAYSWQIKPGYQHKFFEAGMTHFALEYGSYNNFMIDASSADRVKDKYKGRTWGAFLVQDFDRIATKIYLGYRRYEAKVKHNPNVKLKNIDAVMGGMSIKF